MTGLSPEVAFPSEVAQRLNDLRLAIVKLGKNYPVFEHQGYYIDRHILYITDPLDTTNQIGYIYADTRASTDPKAAKDSTPPYLPRFGIYLGKSGTLEIDYPDNNISHPVIITLSTGSQPNETIKVDAQIDAINGIVAKATAHIMLGQFSHNI